MARRIAYQVFVTTNGEPYASRGEINPGLTYTSVGGGGAYKQCQPLLSGDSVA